MSEFPSKYPDVQSYVNASLVIKCEGFGGGGLFDPADDLINSVMRLFTPTSILEETFHPTELILGEALQTFDDLITERERIRMLELLPKRAQPIQLEYDHMSKETFLRIVNSYYLNDSPLTLVRELYPYELPEQIGQHVVWIRDDNTPDSLIAQFIGGIMKGSELTANDVVLFERSRKSESNFARVSVPERRHIHMLTRDARLLRGLRYRPQFGW